MSSYNVLDREVVRSATKPLRWIFWGGLLWILDLTFTTTTNGSGFRCDILDDTVGTLLITAGLFRLAAARVGGSYRGMMKFCKAVAIASVVETAIKHFVFPYPTLLIVAFNLLGLFELAATLVFCAAMRAFCDAAALPAVSRSWRTTFLLFVLIYAAPLGFMYLLALLAAMGSGTFYYNMGPAALLLLPLFAWPLVHLFISTSRMRRAAEAGPGPTPPPGGFPVILPNPDAPTPGPET